MNRLLVFPIACVLLAMGSGPKAAADADTVEVTTCSISAWSTDKDLKGLNIRAAPREDSPIIGNIPPPIELDGDPFAAEVTITGSRDGWFRISEAYFIDYHQDRDNRNYFEGEGWVFGRHLGLLLNHIYLYQTPSPEAPTVGRLVLEDPESVVAGPDSFAVTRLYACNGDCVEVDAELDDKKFHGWATGTCSNQVTTCP